MSRVTQMALVLVLLAAAGCSTAPKKDLALERVRSELAELQADPELAGLAPLALGEAERALRQAETATGSETHRHHLLYMADRRIEIARAVAQREKFTQELKDLQDAERQMRVRASRREAELARQEAEQAFLISRASAEDADRARMEAAAAREVEAESTRQAEQALAEASQARRLAESRASEADLARREAELASAQAATLQRQLKNLQLRQTESGVVVTLGDVLFDTGEAELRSDAAGSLQEVVDLLQGSPDQNIRIEGHTDSTGSPAANLALSERRAASVREMLTSLGVEATRMTSLGLGSDFPIASNATEEGRARNRRVDVILLD